uniref:Predicted protein n=1 Tax=Hordeum vulgare subsp. vulgare TaxID=112509 RepID=F2EEE6_HORVV|nr:predicted protein [Hordeum vulgare subsp. vulgare]
MVWLLRSCGRWLISQEDSADTGFGRVRKICSTHAKCLQHR